MCGDILSRIRYRILVWVMDRREEMSDSYSVRYTMKNKESGYWEPKEDIIFMNGKNKHRQVEREFKSLHRKDEYTIINIDYQ